MVKKYPPWAASVVLLILVAGCSNPAGETQPKPGAIGVVGDLAGTWSRTISGRPSTLTLGSDRTFQTDFLGDAGVEVFGTFTLSGGQVSFTDLGGPQAGLSTQVGVYGYTLSGKSLTFTLVSDGATGRATIVPGTWTRP